MTFGINKATQSLKPWRYCENNSVNSQFRDSDEAVKWSLCSCDVTSLDIFLWGYVKSKVYMDKPGAIEALEDNITRIIRQIPLEVLGRVDTDEGTLFEYQHRAAPLISDHLIQREVPLRIEIFKGSIDVSDQSLLNSDAIIAIEIIEHLFPDVLENVPYNIFGFIQPKLAIFSTPNVDFNVLFNPLENGFRHFDHKFEWSREQFKDWALNICERYPNYSVSIFGVGKAPANSPDLGPVSQFALFVRKDILHMPLATELEEVPSDTSPDKKYKEIYAVEFPQRHDERTLDQKIIDESSFFINQYRTFELYHNPDRLIYQIPFDMILQAIAPVSDSPDDLRRVLLEQGHVIEDEFVVVPEDDDNRMERHWSDDDDSNYNYGIYEEDDDADLNNLTNGHAHEGNEEDDSIDHQEEEECWD